MQQKIIFKSKGLNCSGLFYLPDNYSATDDVKLPAIAMAHGMGTTKEVGLPQFAERFADAGFAVLIFDFRNLGESEGTPRGQIFAEDQQEDYRNAITWLQLQSQIDPERIGVWGFSFSGGHVLQIAAFDRRIKCVVAQVPAVSGFLAAQRSNTPSDLYGVGMMLSQDRIRRYETGEVNYLPFVAPPGQPCFFPSSEEAREFFEAAQVASEGRFENRITFESLERLSYFEPAVRIDAISPTPLRMILAKKDFLVPTDIALAAYARAHEPKSLVFLEGGHLGKSEGEDFETASAAARDWFVQWLKPSNAAAQTYDPHSEYLGKSNLESFEINMRLSLTGIGAELKSEDGYAKVERLISGGPAQLSGKVTVGDRIAAVGQGKDSFVDVVDMKIDKVVELIRGKKGSVVRLMIVPANSADPSKRKIVELVRDDVKLTEQEAKAELIEKDLPDGTVKLPVVDGIPQISVQELKRKLDAKEDVFVLDVREPHEHRIVNLGTSLIPVGDIERRASELADKKNSEIVVYCKVGVRSQKAALALKQAGFTNISNLTGGILAWAEKIDPSMEKH